MPPSSAPLPTSVQKLRDDYGLPFVLHYLRHRRRYSNMLMLAFTAYVLQSTYGSLTGQSKQAKAQAKQAAQDGASEKAAQAAAGGGRAAPPSPSAASTRRRSRGTRVEVDALFFRRLSVLLRIVLPSFRSKEVSILLLHTFFLVLRTLLSLYVASLDGSIVSALVRAQPAVFAKRIAMWMAVAVPATYTNSMLVYLQSKLAIAYRTRLTRKIQDDYLTGSTFYALGNLDDRIKNADQLIVVDVQKFSNSLAEIYSNIAKPVLDVILYNYQLSRNVGAEGLIALTVVVQASAALLKLATPPFGRYAAEQQRLEGEYRFAHTRLLEHAEEVALLRGSDTEKNLIERSYFALLKHINRTFRLRFVYSIVEEAVCKWLWGSLGLMVCAVPVFGGKLLGMAGGTGRVDLGRRTEGFVTNRRLLLSASDALGRLMSTYRDLSELSGYTARVSELMQTMEDVKEGRYEKRVVGGGDVRTKGEGGKKEGGDAKAILQGRGTVLHSDDEIIFEQVPIVTPNGDVLIMSLSFHVKPGNHLLVVGGNGTGKSSLFRILGGLWPVYGGTVTKPPNSDFTYIPQRPYLSIGTLRDQIIYPHTRQQMISRGVTDADLLDMLKTLDVDSMVQAQGGWAAQKEWRDTLSGGDKQRLAMARLFYHAPKFAILDECTSAVTLDVEKRFYERATELGITLLTVSHRPSLWKYHTSILQLFGNGEYAFGPLDDADKRLALQEEKQALEARLGEVAGMETRLADLLREKQAREERKERV
ncbi:hypothetical protein JCM10213_000303 [Rhodosporidiobolus nylandii]